MLIHKYFNRSISKGGKQQKRMKSKKKSAYQHVIILCHEKLKVSRKGNNVYIASQILFQIMTRIQELKLFRQIFSYCLNA